MASKTLTSHDLNVLEKIKDPESAPSVPLLIDSSLPRDPHVTDPTAYEKIAAAEGEIIKEFQALEARIGSCAPSDEDAWAQVLADYDACISNLAALTTAYPTYASAHNNYAQALRRKYGESVLLRTPRPLPSLAKPPSCSNDATISTAASTILSSLNTAIALLTPPTPFAAISAQAAKTLSQAHTQRGALYHSTAKQMLADREACLRIDGHWTAVDLEEMASRDFVMGGRYGNEIARALAVATNPTAKLCGSIVREAMRKEFGEMAA